MIFLVLSKNKKQLFTDVAFLIIGQFILKGNEKGQVILERGKVID
ncbi:hypothetical protein RV18_GL002857 [Enterococcus termitis]|nr:hypothetical protein RV18_GL002857 [Enterococcus termitis]